MQKRMRFLCLLAPLSLSACAGMDEFMGGMNQGMKQQQRYNMTPEQRERAAWADLPAPPPSNVNAPGVLFECTAGNVRSRYKVTATDWFVSTNYAPWQSRHCNVGAYRSGMGGSVTTTCGTGGNLYTSTISVHNFGRTHVSEHINGDSFTIKHDGRTTAGSCKELKQ